MQNTYSANVFEAFAHTGHTNMSDFSVPYVIWGIDGNLRFRAMPAGTLFATTDHCGAAKILNPQVDPQYLAYVLERTKHLYGFDRGLRASLINMKNVEVSIPIDENGDYDLQAQQQLATAFTFMNVMRRELQQKHQRIAGLTITADLSEGYSFRLVKVSDAYDIVRGSGKYTKTYAQGHRGDYPLYSGNTSQEFASIDSFDYDVPCLSWAIDGLAGYMMVHRNVFSATNHRGILMPKLTDIDIDYAKFVLEPVFRRAKKGRLGDNGENEYTSLPPFMIKDLQFEVPVDTEGGFDLAVQKEIASKYLTIEQYKREVLEKLTTLITQKVEL